MEFVVQSFIIFLPHIRRLTTILPLCISMNCALTASISKRSLRSSQFNPAPQPFTPVQSNLWFCSHHLIMQYSTQWKAYQQELEAQIQQESGVTVAHVQGSPGSGQDTTMILELAVPFTNRFPNASIMLVYPVSPGPGLPSSSLPFQQFLQEARETRAPDVSQTFDSGRAGTHTHATFFDDFKEEFKKHARYFQSPALVFWHLDLLPTLEGEVALTALIAGAVAAVQVCPQRVAIVLVASQDSRRVSDAFQIRLGRAAVANITLPDLPATVSWKVHTEESDELPSWVPATSLAEDATSCVILGGVQTSSSYHPLPEAMLSFGCRGSQTVSSLWRSGVAGLRLLQGCGTARRPSQYIMVQHDQGWSTPLKGLCAVYSPSHVRGTLFDASTGQLFTRERELTRGELKSVQSWAYRSAAEFGTDTEIVATYSREDMDKFVGPDADALGSAWNSDLLFTVLKIRDQWPGLSVGDIPMPYPIQLRSWLLAETVLDTCGYLEESTASGQPTPTAAGTLLCNNVRWPGLCRNWNAAVLLHLCVEIEAGSTGSVVSRILCTMAALVEQEACNQLLRMEPDLDWPNGIDMAAISIGPGRYEAYAGSLWFTFAMFCHDYDLTDPHIPATRPLEECGSEVYVMHNAARCVKEKVRNLFSFARIDTVMHSAWHLVKMSPRDLAQVQTALAKAFLFHFLWFGPTSQVSDIGRRYEEAWATSCHTGQQVMVSGNLLVLDLGRLRTSFPAGFYAFYTGPLVESSVGSLVTDQVTYIPTAILREIARSRGQQWPNMVASNNYGLSR